MIISIRQQPDSSKSCLTKAKEIFWDQVPLSTDKVVRLDTLYQNKILETLLEEEFDEKAIKQQHRSISRHFFTKMASGLGLASAILVGVGLVSYRGLTSLVHNHDLQIHQYQVMEDLKDIRSAIHRATLAEYRYIATGQGSYLTSYADAAAEARAKIGIFQQATANDPNQQLHLAVLEPLITKNLIEIRRITHLRKTNETEIASQELLLQNAQKLTEDIEAIGEMERTENALLQQRSRQNW